MENDALDAGIRPGGLRNKQDIKILICYILSKTKLELSPESIEQALVRSQLVNYFEAADCISDLIKKGNVAENDGICSLTRSGREIADLLETNLPPSVRDRAVGTALEIYEREKKERENIVNILPCSNGYKIECKILGGQAGDLLAFSLTVADKEQANVIKEHFLESPDIMYSATIALLTGNKDFVKTTLEALN